MKGRTRVLRSWWLIGLALCAALFVVGGLLIQHRINQSELENAREALRDQRYAAARDRLARLADVWSNDGEVFVLLGESELARGDRKAALAAWARVRPESSHFARAALLAATQYINTGHYRPAEDVLRKALEPAPASIRYDLERALCRLYRFEGRTDDVRRVLRGSWRRSPDPAGILRELWFLDTTPVPVEALQLALDKADDTDDRVWLGRANLATLTGRFNDAARWIERCLNRSSGDAAVWSARLDHALATDDLAGFWLAADHLPASPFDAQAVHALRAWIAARHHDDMLERNELAEVVGTIGGSARALERLSLLTFEAGEHEKAARLRQRKADADHAQGEIRKMMLDGEELAPRADQLARYCQTLGRNFDTAAWTLLAAANRQNRTGKPVAAETRSPETWPEPLAQRVLELCSPYQVAGAELASRVSPLSASLNDLRQMTDPGVTRSLAENDRPRPNRTSPAFVDDAETSGLRFLFDNGHTPRFLLPETNSGGVALLDFDGDGWLDVYCVQGGVVIPLNDSHDTAPPDGDRLFRNRGDATFEDATEASGLARIARGHGYGMGVTAGDYDNDGKPDLFVTRLETYVLYRNRGDGTFEDVTERSGLAGKRDNPSSAAFADLDNDGDLDLYVCHYMKWNPADPPVCLNEKGDYFYCSPQKVQAAPDHVFRNDRGQFIDVTESAGFAETEGHGLGVVAADLDDDNRIDIYVANDGTANYFYQNKGGFHFEEVGLQAGVAGSAEGGYRAGMGVACGDIDGDGRADLIVTNFYGEGVTYYQNLGQGLFTDRSAASGLGLATRYLLGFGIATVDVSNRGRLDVMITNGHVNDNRPYYLYAMPSRLYENRTDGRFVDVSDEAGAPWAVPRVGRGLAAGDLDNDGRVDAVIVAQNEPAAFFHNRTIDVGHFVSFTLAGVKSNRYGIGARVTLMAGGRKQTAQRTGGGSYQSSNDPRLHFGLADQDRIASVEVRWPSGIIDRWTNLAVDRGYILREGNASAIPAPRFARGCTLIIRTERKN